MHNILILVLLAVALAVRPAGAQDVESSPYGDFVEDDFPFITTGLVADSLGLGFPARSESVRGIVVRLDEKTYLCFDPDLLRMAVAWEGEFMSMTTMAQVSYHKLDKGNTTPRILGDALAANGMYSGWMAGPTFRDPRAPVGDVDDPGRGPLPFNIGAYSGLYVDGAVVVFSYRVRGAQIAERPGLLRSDHAKLVTRTFNVGPATEPLSLSVIDVTGASLETTSGDEVTAGVGSERMTAVFASGAGVLRVADGRHVTLHLAPSDTSRSFRVAMWRGPREFLAEAESLAETPITEVAGYRRGGPARWSQSVTTGEEVAPDTAAFVFDHLQLPDPNPWKRNVRPADIAFFADGRAAVVTFDGDVWIANGLSQGSAEWHRFASGLYEPLAVEVVDGELYTYGREGILRLKDLNGDGEADYYEAFAPGIIQSTASREWPFDLVARPGGGFLASQGGALYSAAERDRRPVLPGFIQGSPHNGTIVSVSSDGKDVSTYATGFRAPYIGVHPETGLVTVSDQQGNFVPSTPIYAVEEGGYYGVPATAHRPDPLPKARSPLTWIPHRVDPSGTSQVWMTAEGNGPLDGHMVHLSYGRSRLFRVFIDSTALPIQGAVTPLPGAGTSPTMKAALSPVDNRLYVAGFQVWGASAQALSSLRRLRYTGVPHELPVMVRAGRQGVLLSFDSPISAPATDAVAVKRYNYVRSEQYGSGHYRLDGTSGEDMLPVAGLHRSPDARHLLVVLPDMRAVMQVELDYELTYRDGSPLEGSVYLTVNDAGLLDLAPYGFEASTWEADMATARPPSPDAASPPVEASAMSGRHLFHEVGCVACHATDGSAQGNLGPGLQGVFGRRRPLESGRSVVADESYLRRSILDPAAEVVSGFDAEMPSFRGILGEGEVESVILFIRSLTPDDREE